MSGGGTTTTTQSGQQTNQPWAPAIPYLTNILGNLGPANTEALPVQMTAANNLVGNAFSVPQYGPQASGLTNNLFNYNSQPLQQQLENAYHGSISTLMPYLNANYTNPMAVPGFANTLKAIGQQTQQATDSLFSAAGRDPAGNADAAKAAATATMNAEAPYLTGEYNSLVGQQQSAEQALLGGATNTMGALSQLQMLPFQTGLEGAQLAEGLPGVYTAPGQAQLTASNTYAGMPLTNLAGLEGLVDPIAGLGGSMSYFGTGQTTQPSNLTSNLLGGGLGLLALGTGGGGTLGGGLLGGLMGGI